MYDTFTLSVFGYLMPLEKDHEDSLTFFEQLLGKLAPGPGNRCIAGDLTNLKTPLSFPKQFRDPRWVSVAAKLRVAYFIAPDCEQREKDLNQVHASHWRQP